MQKNRWQKIEEVFNRAVALPAAERVKFVKEACPQDDAELCREILLLINADGAEKGFLDEPAFALGAQLLEADDRLPEESEFASYRIKKLLGRGGMGAVYLAEDVRLERSVALKILPSLLGENTDGVMRFRQEARAASAISHQNVAHIYEFGEAGERYFLAMEYVEGKTLRELLKEKAIDAPVALEIVLQIADALVAMHKRGIVHRDIKPENVIVTESGLVKVLDFGLAKLSAPPGFVENEKPLASLETTPGMIIGTTAYMSPEQVRGISLDARTDLWSLGVLLFEMLAGKRPFAGATPSDIQAAILLKDAPLLAIPTNAALVVSKLLKKDLNDRYQSAEELLPDLRRLKNEFETQKKPGANPSEKISTDDIAGQSQSSAFLTGAGKLWNKQNLSAKILLFAGLIGLLTFIVGFSARYLTQSFAVERSAPAFSTIPKIESLAVLPFDNETGDQEIDYLSKGLADDLIRNLGQANAFSVISLSTSQKIKEQKLSYEEIKQDLQIKTLLEGNVKKENGMLFVEIRLVDLSDSRTIWQERLNVPGGDLLKLRNALALLLSNKLQELEDSEKHLVLAEYPTANNEAYRLYLEAKFGRKETTVAEIKRLIVILEKAVRLDPNYTLAIIALAENYNLLGTFLGQSPEYYQPKAKETLERALALDDLLSEAHTLLGKIKMDYEHDWTGCEREFQRAIKINPNNELAHHWYGEVYLSAMNRLDESVAELEISRRLNPLSSGILTALAWTYIGKDEYQKAIDLCDLAFQVNPDDNDIYQYRAQAFFKLNRFDEAVQQMDEAIKADPEETRYYALKAVFLASAGKIAEASKIRSELKNKSVSKYSLAIVENALGNRDKAFELLNQELATKSVDLLSIKIDPLLDSLRDDSRFVELERKLKLPN